MVMIDNGAIAEDYCIAWDMIDYDPSEAALHLEIPWDGLGCIIGVCSGTS
jgi:hypothetical protein